MKKVIMGSIVFLTGVLSLAVIVSGAMVHDWTIDGQHSVFWNLSRYGVMPILYGLTAIAVLGLIIAVWGLFEKK